VNRIKIKYIDFVFQISILILCVLFAFFSKKTFFSQNFGVPLFESYIIVGVSQIISAIFWTSINKLNSPGMRKAYNCAVVLLFILF
jgi:uncharacterized membrane protein (DUF485 family)